MIRQDIEAAQRPGWGAGFGACCMHVAFAVRGCGVSLISLLKLAMFRISRY